MRRLPGEPGLWHTAEPGLAGLRPVPRQIESRVVTLRTSTYLRYADESGRLDRREDLGSGTVRVHCGLRVSDLMHDPVPGLTDGWPPHGVIWLELRSDDAANPSFTVPFEVLETVNVGPDGRTAGQASDRVTYASGGLARLEARVGVFPSAYFEQYRREEEAFFTLMKEVNDKFVMSNPVGTVVLGPPPDVVDPLGPFWGTRRIGSIARLLDDPMWSAALVGEMRRTNPDLAGIGVESVRTGLARLTGPAAVDVVASTWQAGQRVIARGAR
jgi:hypothetical protein